MSGAPALPAFGEALKTWAFIGCVNFGGPAGQIALMHRILVEEKNHDRKPDLLDGLDLTAAEILNTWDRSRLTDILRRFGEEKFASRIAGFIVERRERAPFTRTGQLVETLYDAIPVPARRTGGHPAKRTFQALRIAVNAELESLSQALPAALAALRPGGRIAVMAYQSLEDRIVKTAFAAATASRTPPGLPVELPGYGAEFVPLTRGAERADAAEVERNPRSAPVRLRAIERGEEPVR